MVLAEPQMILFLNLSSISYFYRAYRNILLFYISISDLEPT